MSDLLRHDFGSRTEALLSPNMQNVESPVSGDHDSSMERPWGLLVPYVVVETKRWQEPGWNVGVDGVREETWSYNKHHSVSIGSFVCLQRM